jgi:hypothetical protein
MLSAPMLDTIKLSFIDLSDAKLYNAHIIINAIGIKKACSLFLIGHIRFLSFFDIFWGTISSQTLLVQLAEV